MRSVSGNQAPLRYPLHLLASPEGWMVYPCRIQCHCCASALMHSSAPTLCPSCQISKYISPHLTKVELAGDAGQRLLEEFLSSVYGHQLPHDHPPPEQSPPNHPLPDQRQPDHPPLEASAWCYGQDDIVVLRQQNGFFVDKTRFIVAMENDGSPHLVLLRPGRSGKSLLHSQMQVCL